MKRYYSIFLLSFFLGACQDSLKEGFGYLQFSSVELNKTVIPTSKATGETTEKIALDLIRDGEVIRHVDKCKDQVGLKAGSHRQQHGVHRITAQIQSAAHRGPDAVKRQHRQQRKGGQHDVGRVVVDRTAHRALIPVAAPGHPDRRGQIYRKADKQPHRAGAFRQGSPQPPCKHRDRRQMEHRQQHGNADARAGNI